MLNGIVSVVVAWLQALPSLLWFILVAVLLVALRKQLGRLLSAAISNVEKGASVSVAGMGVGSPSDVSAATTQPQRAEGEPADTSEAMKSARELKVKEAG